MYMRAMRREGSLAAIKTTSHYAYRDVNSQEIKRNEERGGEGGREDTKNQTKLIRNDYR